MKLNRLFLLGLIFWTGILNAQTDFRQGYIIKVSGDTLFGQIDYRGDILMGEVCRFRTNNKEKDQKYLPSDIVEFRFIGSKYFASKEVNGAKVFLEFLVKGKINIYYLRDYFGDHYFLEKDGDTIIELPYKEGIKYINKKYVYFETKKHLGLLNYHMKEVPDFQSRIFKTGKPEQESLLKLDVDYHNKVCADSDCIIYQKKLPSRKVNFEAVAGVVNSDLFNQKNNFQSGIIAHFWMPRTSEKSYFRTGILYSTFEVNNVKEKFFKIPLQIEYIYPKGVFRPIMAFGVNLYSPFYQSVAFMGGLNIRFNKSLSLGLSYDIDFAPDPFFPLLPRKFLSHSILTGFIVKI